MRSGPLMLFRGGDVEIRGLGKLRVRSKTPKLASSEWLTQLLTGFAAQLTGINSVPRSKGDLKTQNITRQMDASSPCPSSSSSNSSASSSSSDCSNSSGDSEDEAPPPPVNGDDGDAGNGGDDEKKKKEDKDDGNSSDSSSSDSSDSDQEEDDGVMIDTDDENDKLLGVDPTDEDLSESDGSSDLENSYPRLPVAPVDTLIAFRQQATIEELQLTDKLKKEVIDDAKQRQQERREQTQRSKKKKKAPQSKRRHSKQSEDRPTHLERHQSNGSTGTAGVQTAEIAEDEWMVDCSCGLHEKNYDDGTSMIQCDSCSHWVHAKCADKQPEAVAQEKFMCFRCSWMFDCVCEVRRRPNHDDGQRMVECESCKTWQHTICVGVPMTEEPADDYRCPRCVKKARRRKSGTKGGSSRERQRKRSRTDSSRDRRKSKDASTAVAVDVRSSARAAETATTPTRANRSRRAETRQSPRTERRAPLAQVQPPPVPAASPPSTPPPPPSTPPPPLSTKRDRSRGRLKKRGERERSSASSISSRRNRGRLVGSSSSSSSTKTYSHSESSEVENGALPQAAVTPSPRGKGLMLRGYSPASSSARTETSSSRHVDVRPPLPLTPPSSSGHSYSSPSHGGRKRKTSSARDRLAKKLKIRKASLR